MGPVLLDNIIGELRGELTGGVVSKVHQSSERLLVLRVYAGRGERRLLISIHPSQPAIYLTEHRFPNPPRPKRFCALLRNRLKNARIESIERLSGERIVEIGFTKKADDRVERSTLVVELTGKSANVILVDPERVVEDAMRRFPQGSKRVVMPGEPLEELPGPGPGAGGRAEDEVEREPGESWNQAADRLYSSLITDAGFASERGRLMKIIRDSLKKARRKLKNLRGDEARAKDGLELYRYGEMILAGMHQLKKGMSEAELTDYTSDPPRKVRVELDTKLTPGENAERYFKKAKKSKRALEVLEKRFPLVASEIEYLEGLLYECESAESAEDLAELEEGLRERGHMRHRQARDKGSKRPERAEPVQRYESSEGFAIIRGRSARGNDLLVREYGKPGDVWLHAKGAPGSHVIVKAAGRAGEITEKTVVEAARIAARHSKLGASGKVEVIYTDFKNVNKPRGAPPGLVTVKEHRSVVVEPADDEG